MPNTIIFAGAEMGNFVPSDSSSYEAVSDASYDSAYARCALRLQGATSSFLRSYKFENLTDFWFHCELSVSVQGGGSNVNSLVFVDDSDNPVFAINTDSFSYIAMFWWNGSSWVQIGSSCYVAYKRGIGRGNFDFHITLGSSGAASFYSQGTLLTTDTANITGTNISKIFLYGVPQDGYWQWIEWSQLIIATQSTIGYKLSTIPITANGLTDQWNGTYTDVNEISYNDTNYISANTAGLTSNFSQPGSVNGEIIAVAVTARASCGVDGPQHLQLELNVGGTEYTSNSVDLGTDFRANGNVWNINPNTNVAWQASDLAGLYYGVVSVA
jgi:hypothetical protein